MNSLLARNRPEELSLDEFKKMWENAGYTLSALNKTIVALSASCDKVKKEDFSVPNHYALLAYQAGQKDAYNEIKNILPKSSF